MNDEYTAGSQGGRLVIDFPKYDNAGNPNKGKKYQRTVWKNGTVVYKEMKDDEGTI